MERAVTENKTSAADEARAVAVVAEALDGLDATAAARVIRWASARFACDHEMIISDNDTKQEADDPAPDAPANAPRQQYETLAELHAALAPSRDAERALVTAYWVQCIQGEPQFGAYKINAALRDLGHRISNITTAFNTLIAQKPQLVVQLKKSGGSKQARKTYKLTAAGKAKVEEMYPEQ